MTDTASVPAKTAKLSPDPADSPESNSQYKTALAIVGGLVVLGIGFIIAGIVSGQWAIMAGPIGTVIGILGTALNTPTGIGKVLNAAKQVPQS